MQSAKGFFQIAIDGPVAAGKGTIAKSLANALGFLYVDTGAMYRAIAWLALQEKLPIEADSQAAIVALVRTAQLKLENHSSDNGDLSTTVLVNNQDISPFIRTETVSAATSKIAALPEVRELLVEKQREIASQFNVVMEGRDIGLRVLPQAQLKLYLTADLAERARRRLAQLQASEPNLTLAQVEQQILQRDERDMNRSVDPLQIVPDAIVIDTTHFDVHEVVNSIASLVKARA